jgi:hypothetical protein
MLIILALIAALMGAWGWCAFWLFLHIVFSAK